MSTTSHVPLQAMHIMQYTPYVYLLLRYLQHRNSFVPHHLTPRSFCRSNDNLLQMTCFAALSAILSVVNSQRDSYGSASAVSTNDLLSLVFIIAIGGIVTMKVFRDNWLEKRRNYQSANVVLDPENSPPAVLPRPQVASALDLTSFEMETESNPLAGPLPSSGEFDNPVFKPGQRVNAGAHTPRPPRMIRGPTREWSQQPQLTQEEYEAQRTDDIVGNLFRAVDADGNGSLTPAEFMKWWSVQCHFEKTVTHKSWLRMQKLLEGVGYHDLYIGRLNQTWLRQRLQDMINDEWTPMTDETGR
eukprot:COSAG05_NODE_1336_length_5147_cov_80.325674_3_plen_300_part_01